MQSSYRVTLLLLLILFLPACSSISKVMEFKDVQPWDRDILAQEKMQLDENAMDLLVDDKIYFSREASRGGGGFGGGGCGCN